MAAPRTNTVTQKELADLVGLTPERLRQLKLRGLPFVTEGGKTKYVVREVVKWMREDAARQVREELAAKAGKLSESEERALLVRVQRESAELDLAEKRRALIPTAEASARYEAFVGSFSAVARGQLQRFEKDIVMAADTVAARRVTQKITGALMSGARELAARLREQAEALEAGASEEELEDGDAGDDDEAEGVA